jgi:hypothetical protein
MDKTPPQLDPKLKEAYDRVMGTVVTPPAPTKTEQAMPAPSAVPTTAMPSTTVSSLPFAQSAQSVQSTPTASNAAVNPHSVSSPISTVQAKMGPQKKSGGFKALIFLLAGIAFFVVYALVWIKMFNLRFPFLNP